MGLNAYFYPNDNTLRSGPVLQVNHLTTCFTAGGTALTAVDDISFDICQGETVGMVGESGSGKSATALSLMRLLPVAGEIRAGTVCFNRPGLSAVNLHSLSGNEMRRYRGRDIAMVFQEPMTSLNPVFTCGAQVMEAIRLHLKSGAAAARERTMSLFRKVELSDTERIFRSYPHQLSGGQKQRVMIAMAMSCDPVLLIADEPTTALDVTVQSRILALMKRLRAENNMSMLFITHDLGVVAEVADRIMVMYKGKIVEAGTTSQIFCSPEHPYTKGLLACRPPLSKKLYRLPVIADFMKEEANGDLATSSELPAISLADNIISAAATEERLALLQRQQPVLTVSNLSVTFPVKKFFFGRKHTFVRAVDDVSLQVYPGETLGLVGESGSGKTTLGKSILQLIRPDAGSVNYKGNELTKLSHAELQPIRRQLQIIFQDPYASLNPRLTVGQAIIEPMTVHRLYASDTERKEKAVELLKKVNMPEESFNRFPHQFSGGQRQRICIARALSLNPEFIVCDECVSSLDVSVQAQVLNLLMQLREEFQLSYIFISHDLAVVRFMSDRIIVMNNGRIAESGTADAIYHHPASEYTKKLISAVPAGIVSTKA
ncbi:MAG: ABC transporter ATP-binding protein [Chitinophagales bacterium]|nr:ABC transporter ATP-binding protein [Chitinophagales bacterium]